MYAVSAVKNTQAKGKDDEFILTSVEINNNSMQSSRNVDYWTAQQIERAILYGKYLAKKEIQDALRLPI